MGLILGTGLVLEKDIRVDCELCRDCKEKGRNEILSQKNEQKVLAILGEDTELASGEGDL